MRLIDADELKKYAIPCQIHNGALTDLCVPLYQIDNAPTIEPERPQGEWILHGMIYYCSVCGHDYEQGGNNFCGNCGAKMGGEEP